MRRKSYEYLIGKKIEQISIIEIDKDKSIFEKRCILNIKCDCGKVKSVRASDVESGNVKTCGDRKVHKIQQYDNIKNMKFGKLTAIKYVNTIKKHAYWLCECECGNYCVVQSSNLKNSHTVSCGCKRITDKSGSFIKHLRNILKPIILKNIEMANYRCEITNEITEVQAHHTTSFKELYEKTLSDLNIKFSKNLRDYSIEEIKEIDKYFLKLNKQEGVIVVISTDLHIQFHRKYGYKNFSKTDFDNFIKNDIK